MKIAFAARAAAARQRCRRCSLGTWPRWGGPLWPSTPTSTSTLAEALGAAADPPPMGAHLPQIKDYLRGSNPRISSAAAMVKTTPPGRGSRLLRPGGPDPVHDLAVTTPCGARLLATGPFGEEDLGVACYHSKTGAVELYLNHLADGPAESVVVDCTAGADSFASGLFTRFDLTVLVAEPTRKGLRVYRQWQEYAADYDVAVVLAGNKVQTDEDVAFLRRHANDDLLTWFEHEPAVRAMEQGRPFGLADLSAQTRAALAVVQGALDARSRDWARYARQAGEVPPEERPRVSQCRSGPGPHRTDRSRLYPRPPHLAESLPGRGALLSAQASELPAGADARQTLAGVLSRC